MIFLPNSASSDLPVVLVVVVDALILLMTGFAAAFAENILSPQITLRALNEFKSEKLFMYDDGSADAANPVRGGAFGAARRRTVLPAVPGRLVHSSACSPDVQPAGLMKLSRYSCCCCCCRCCCHIQSEDQWNNVGGVTVFDRWIHIFSQATQGLVGAPHGQL